MFLSLSNRKNCFEVLGQEKTIAPDFPFRLRQSSFEVAGQALQFELEEEKAHFNKVWHRLKGWPDSVAGLTRLKKHYVIAPLSNGNVSLLTDMAKFGGLPWDAILSTELVRHYKPDKETYLMPGEFWDLKPEKVMMVAAHAGDLDAAKALAAEQDTVELFLYPGDSHLFADNSLIDYDQDAATLLKLRVREFLENVPT